MICEHCKLERHGGVHSPDWCLDYVGPEVMIRVPIAGSMFARQQSRPAPVPPPLPPNLGVWVGPAVRDKTYADGQRLLAAGPRPGWLPRPHVLPPEELADLMTADAAGVGPEALEVAVYHLIEAASNARRARIQHRAVDPSAIQPQLTPGRIGVCALCSRPSAPGRLRCPACERERAKS